MHRFLAEADARVRTEQVPVENWPAGVYVLSIQVEGSAPVVRKFVVE
jgi:hypothetical protein